MRNVLKRVPSSPFPENENNRQDSIYIAGPILTTVDEDGNSLRKSVILSNLVKYKVLAKEKGENV